MTNVSQKHVKEPLFHVSKRPFIKWWKAWLIRVVAIIASLLVCSVVIVVLTKFNPMEVFKQMFNGSFSSSRKLLIMFQNLAMLLCISLAVTPAFKMRFWNLGAEGQVLVGALATAACMFYFDGAVPSWLMIIIMFVLSILAGIIWGFLPAFAKAIWGTNETLFTLMMNYIAMQLVSFAIAVWVPNGSSVMGVINQTTQYGWLPKVFNKDYIINIIVVLLLTVIMYIYLKFSKQGYEISVVGESVNTAKYIGINVKKVIIRTMIISGAICGLAGFLLVSGTNHTITKELAGGMGFTAVMVSWLAKFNPITMILTSFLIVFLQLGAGQISMACNLNSAISDILTGIILFFIIGCEFFINYKLNMRSSHKEVK